jgi:hypothetical protein
MKKSATFAKKNSGKWEHLEAEKYFRIFSFSSKIQ